LNRGGKNIPARAAGGWRIVLPLQMLDARRLRAKQLRHCLSDLRRWPQAQDTG